MKKLIYTGVLGSFLRVGDAGDFSLFSGSLNRKKIVKQKEKGIRNMKLISIET